MAVLEDAEGDEGTASVLRAALFLGAHHGPAGAHLHQGHIWRIRAADQEAARCDRSPAAEPCVADTHRVPGGTEPGRARDGSTFPEIAVFPGLQRTCGVR